MPAMLANDVVYTVVERRNVYCFQKTKKHH